MAKHRQKLLEQGGDGCVFAGCHIADKLPVSDTHILIYINTSTHTHTHNIVTHRKHTIKCCVSQ